MLTRSPRWSSRRRERPASTRTAERTENTAVTESETALEAPAGPAIDNRVFVLVLQHPQERAEPRATAAAAVATLRQARLVVGLSWPNLAGALGRRANQR